jgi:hypothetical protein
LDVQEEIEQQRNKHHRGFNRARRDIWTQEKADERALGQLIEMDLRDEGVAEFLELSQEILGMKVENAPSFNNVRG